MIYIQKKNEQIKSYFIKANEKIDSGDAESALEYVTKLEESKEEGHLIYPSLLLQLLQSRKH